ncbi:MAG: hypothetical protein CM15mP4_0640 [Candidatus Neomarinimicrobiota bacterium]|nr:MAG: hypothetical protein CM15mP4_0640 [Candidatus Neomarinimicrobiota bacterium]
MLPFVAGGGKCCIVGEFFKNKLKKKVEVAGQILKGGLGDYEWHKGYLYGK